MYFLKNLLLYSGARFRKTKYIVMMTKERSTKIVNFMTPWAGVIALGCGHISHIVKIHYFFKILLLFSQAQIKQTKYIVIMTKEGSTKIVNFMTPAAGVLALRQGWPYKSQSENTLFFLKIFFLSPRHKSDNLFIQ